MTKRRGDLKPEPAGGRAAERLKMFLEARRPPSASAGSKQKGTGKRTKKTAKQKKKR